jgi:catechol 2,3-dioxygenase-like lactoylglutathione lyase family enzyme
MSEEQMSLPVQLDHCVIHVSDWERSNAFYRHVLGAELVPRPAGFAYRFGDKQLNVHGPGVAPAEVARLPVQPGNSDLCFEWQGPIADAVAHLGCYGVAVERGPLQRFGAKGPGTSVYFRDPDGSLMEFMSYRPGPWPAARRVLRLPRGAAAGGGSRQGKPRCKSRTTR